MTIVCGDSHTSTHGAFGALGFGIGTSQIRDVLATQCVAMSKQQVRRIEVTGSLPEGVYAKDIILKIIADLGVDGGVGYVYEYGGEAVEALGMDGRMSICNMSIEGGARAGYVNPDETTFDYLKGRRYVPQGEAWDEAVRYWRSIRSDDDADYDDRVRFDGSALEPRVTWGTHPGQGIGITEPVPDPARMNGAREATEQALRHMDLRPGQSMQGVPIDVAFLGSCTNARISDLREAARLLQETGGAVDDSVRALVVPGSEGVKQQAEEERLDAVFRRAGFEWRGAGCSMCLGMNEDQLEGRELCASSSNRNFVGRQGSPDGRTVLMSPAMVVAAAVNGEVTDVRTMMDGD
jgi:3-isopropylmalate/(R)-2-methylmalate dehydratase large subunit